MKSIDVRASLAMLFLLGFGLCVSQAHATGPAAAQQSVSQVQTALTEASLGWHRGGWGHGGWGHGGWGRGGWGYGGLGYGGLGGWGRRGYGWGGYPSYGYGGYGGYGYSGYGYASPVVYSYPNYSYLRVRAPRYYSGYNYSGYNYPGYNYTVPYQSSCCCSNTYVAPTCCASNYSYPSQPLVYSSSSYSTPASFASRYSTQASNLTSRSPATAVNYWPSGVYTPSSVSTVTPTPQSPSAYRSAPVRFSTRVAAPYPAPPVEYAKPTPIQGPIASRPVVNNEYEMTVSARPKALRTMINSPAYSTALSAVTHSAYVPTTRYSYSETSPLALRINYGRAW